MPRIFESRPTRVFAAQYRGQNLDPELHYVAPGRLSVDEFGALWLLAGPNGESGPVQVPIGTWVCRSETDPSDLWPVADERFQQVYDVPEQTPLDSGGSGA